MSRGKFKTFYFPGLWRRPGRKEGERDIYSTLPGLRPPLRDRQAERPVRLCPRCGGEQYGEDQGSGWRGRRICAQCMSRLEEEEEDRYDVKGTFR